MAYFEPGINVRRYTDHRNTADALPFFELLAVQHIGALIDNLATFSWLVAHPPSPRSLESLNVSFVREGRLGKLLSVTQGLRKLQRFWVWREYLHGAFVTDIVDLEKIAADLSRVRGTLTDLAIRAATHKAGGRPEFCPITIKDSSAVSHLSAIR
jgi:hypothetical protein